MEPVSRLVFLSFTDLSDTGADAATIKDINKVQVPFSALNMAMLQICYKLKFLNANDIVKIA